MFGAKTLQWRVISNFQTNLKLPFPRSDKIRQMNAA